MDRRHFDATRKWLLDPALRDCVDCLKPPTPEKNKTYWAAHLKSRHEMNCAILDETGKHIGNCGLRSIDLERKKAELWIYLGEKRGKKIGAATVLKLLRTGFNKMKLNRIYVRVLKNNKTALNFFKSLGFTQEGVFRHDTLQNKKFVDSVYFSMLAAEYAR